MTFTYAVDLHDGRRAAVGDGLLRELGDATVLASADVRTALTLAALADGTGPDVVLAVALLTGSGWLVAVQALVFAVGVLAGLRSSPYGLVFRTLVAPRLGPVREREPEAPPRFAQLVGLLFTVVGAAGYLLGAPLLGAVATGLALVAAVVACVLLGEVLRRRTSRAGT